MTGRRVYPREDGHLYLAEGDYGFDKEYSVWMCRAPGTHGGNLSNHQVTEHEDGTITVSPSILIHDFDKDGNPVTWHGYLEHGIWRQV